MALRFQSSQIDSDQIEIATTRLHLRPPVIDDAQQIFEEFSSEITTYMMPNPATDISETEEFIEKATAAQKTRTEYHWVISNRDTHEFLGICGLHGRSQPNSPELGIWLKKSAHGNHYGYEAIEALVAWVCENVICDFLIYPVDRRNLASRKIAQRLGGAIIDEKEIRNMSGNMLDEIVYRISVGSAGA